MITPGKLKRQLRWARLLAALPLVVPASNAGAAKLNVGPEAIVRHIQDVRLQNATGEPLFLGYKITFHWLGLPYSLSNDGYVLGVKGKPVHYAIQATQLAEWQAQGYVPSTLPAHRLSLADHVLGSLLWITLGLVAGCYGVRMMLAWRKHVHAAAKARSAASSPTPALPPERTAQALAGPAKPKPAPVASSAPPVAPAPPIQNPAPKPAASQPAQTTPPQQAPQQPATPTHPQPQTPRSAADVTRLPVAKTVVRVKALKVA